MAAYDYSDGGFPASPSTDDTLAMKGTTYKYNGSAWEVQTGGTTSYVYTSTSGQTAFTGSDDNSKTLAYTTASLHVFLNGVLLDADDYTADDGTTVTLDTGAATGDTLQIVAYGVLVSSGGGGGAWTEISSTTVSSAVAQIEYTLSGYSVYKILYWGCNWGSNDNNFALDMTVGSGSYSETLKFHMHRFGGSSSANHDSVYAGTDSKLEMWPGTRVDSSNGSNFGEITIFNTAGMPTLQIRDNLMDDTSLSVGITHAIAGFSSPSSTDTIGKIKLIGSQGNNFEAGNFALYGLN
jgi:hypothetical protein